jgi:hypothetical protein
MRIMTGAAQSTVKRTVLNGHLLEFSLKVMAAETQDFLSRNKIMFVFGAVRVVTDCATTHRHRAVNIFLVKGPSPLLVATEAGALFKVPHLF